MHLPCCTVMSSGMTKGVGHGLHLLQGPRVDTSLWILFLHRESRWLSE